MLKKTIAIVVAVVLLLGCGVAAVSAIAAANKPVLPANFFINFDGSSLDIPETASVIHVEKVIFDPYETAEALLQHKDAEYNMDGEGPTWRHWIGDEIDEFLTVPYTGMSWSTNRSPSGIVRYKLGDIDFDWDVGYRFSVHNLAPFYDRQDFSKNVNANRYLGTEDFDDLTLSDAKETLDSALAAIGVPMDGLVNTRTFRLSVDDQDQYLKDEDAYWAALWAEHDIEYDNHYWSPDAYDTLSNSFTFEYRQVFDGIPITGTEWSNKWVPEQAVYGHVSANGNSSIYVYNVYEETSREEARTLATYNEALESLIAVFEDSDLQFEHHLIDAELCYGIYNDNELYPLWVFTVLDDHEISYTGFIGDDTYIDSRTQFYTFDGFTGEFIVASDAPLN